MLDELKAQYEQSRRLWDMAVDTAGDREPIAKEAADAAMDSWRDALAAVEAGKLDAAREALEEACVLADEWGDDSTERAAIKMLDGDDAEEE